MRTARLDRSELGSRKMRGELKDRAAHSNRVVGDVGATQLCVEVRLGANKEEWSRADRRELLLTQIAAMACLHVGYCDLEDEAMNARLSEVNEQSIEFMMMVSPDISPHACDWPCPKRRLASHATQS